jgi:hypothetical protein
VLVGRSIQHLSATGLAVFLVAATVVGTTGAVASADTRPPASTPATVSVDPLPTVQINGVVWAQVTVGKTVYATGSFSAARPAGFPAGSHETARANLLAYDITTGALVTRFDHSLNAQGLALAVSPDRKHLYVGGDFTTVDGAAHSHLAAFDLPSGALVAGFTAGPDGKVKALAATDDKVYVGGQFATSSNGATRSNLAAYSSTGQLLPWAPATNAGVAAMVMSPDRSLVVIGGSFGAINGRTYHAMGAIGAASGAPVPWASQSNSYPVRSDSASSGITSLSTDGTSIFFTAFNYQQHGAPAKPEGRGAISPDDGSLLWINDCHGDSYSAFPIGQVLYSASHAHDCEPIGAFPEVTPRVWHHGLAETTYATHTNGPATNGYASFEGLPASTQLDWYPSFGIGSYTGQYQAAWSVTGNANYVAYGGEFPTVNGVPQQGLVRFAISSIAPDRYGPVAYTSAAASANELLGVGKVTVKTTWDPDNAVLHYAVYRNGGFVPVYTTDVDTRFWSLPTFSFTDDGLTLGAPNTYRVVVTDPFGNRTTG